MVGVNVEKFIFNYHALRFDFILKSHGDNLSKHTAQLKVILFTHVIRAYVLCTMYYVLIEDKDVQIV